MEILFRGKTEDGKWVYGLPSYTVLSGGKIDAIETYLPGCTMWTLVIPETIAPFIGVTDSTGKKMFRDDRCSIYTDGKDVETVCMYSEHHTSYYLQAVNNGEGGPFSPCYTYCGAKAVRVVGTIHDK